MKKVVMLLIVSFLIIGASYNQLYANEEEFRFIVQLNREVTSGRWIAYAPENEAGKERLRFHVVLPRDGGFVPGQYLEVKGTLDRKAQPPIIKAREVSVSIQQSYAAPPETRVDAAAFPAEPPEKADPNVISVVATIGDRLQGFRWEVRDRQSGEEYVAHFVHADGEVLPKPGSVYTLFGRLNGVEADRKVLAVFRDISHDTGHNH